MIESRYTIEYVNPEATTEGKLGKKHYLLFIILGVIISAALVFTILSIGKSNPFIRVSDRASSPQSTIDHITNEPENIVAATATILEEENTIKAVEAKKEIEIQPNTQIILASTNEDKVNSVQEEVNTLLKKNQTGQQLANNKELADNSLNKITKQLMAERKRNKALDKQLNNKKLENNQLSALLQDAIAGTSKEDKSYLNSLEKIEKQEALSPSKDLENSNPDMLPIAVAENITTKVDHYNSVSLSAVSQMDAIIAVMQGGKSPTPSPVINNKPINATGNVQLASVNHSKTELLQIQLQKKINEMLSSNSPTPTINSYTKPLEVESKVRQNAVRSITIRKGETLWGIAQRAYGNGSQYKKIIEANPQININLLQEGQVIRVPN